MVVDRKTEKQTDKVSYRGASLLKSIYQQTLIRQIRSPPEKKMSYFFIYIFHFIKKKNQSRSQIIKVSYTNKIDARMSYIIFS